MLAIIWCIIFCLSVCYPKIWRWRYTELYFACFLYGCETWSLTLREERRLRVFEDRVLRRIFGPKRDEVTGECRKSQNEELTDLYCSPHIIRVVKSWRMRRAGSVARMGEGRGAYRILVGKPEGKRAHGRPRRRWEDNIKTDLIFVFPCIIIYGFY